jgi:hypothetical protein
MAKNNCTFAADIVEWNTYLATSRALKTQLIAAIDPTFIDELKHDTLGFASTSCCALVEHLQNTYTRMTPSQLNKNEQELSREWDLSQVPIEKNVAVLPPLATIPSPKTRPCEKP